MNSPSSSNRNLASLSVVYSLKKLLSKDFSQNQPLESYDEVLSQCLERLGRELSLENRINFLNEFCEFISQNRIDRMFLEHLWSRVKDFFGPQHPKEVKAAGLHFIRVIAQYHTDRLGIIKAGK